MRAAASRRIDAIVAALALLPERERAALARAAGSLDAVAALVRDGTAPANRSAGSGAARRTGRS
jgi:hypothetical protein